MAIGPSFIASSLLGGLFDRETTRRASDAQERANQATIAAQRQSREEARQDLTGTAGNVQTTRIPGGGYESRFTRGSSGDIFNRGDVGRAGAANKASRDFALTIPDVATAQGIVDRDNTSLELAQQKAYNDATLRARQQGDPNSSDFNANTAYALQDISNQFRTNREQNANELFQTGRDRDIGSLQAWLTANQALAPDIRGVGTTASAIGSQLPLPSRTIDSSATAGPAAASNFISQLMEAQVIEDANKQQLAMISAIGDRVGPRGFSNRAIGDEGGFTNVGPAAASVRRNALAPSERTS